MSESTQLQSRFPRVLVTGATGLVGNNVVRLLAAAGVQVRVLMRRPQANRPVADLPVEICSGDVTNADSVRAAMDGMSAVVHAAGCILLGWQNAALHEAVNHLGTQHVATAARQAGVKLVHISSINALGHGLRDRVADEDWTAGPNVACPYVTSKQAAERAVQAEIAAGLDACTVLPALMFGPWDWKPSSGRMLLEVARRFTPLAPAGGVSVCDVRDVAHAILRALVAAPPGRTFVLAGHNVTYLELWRRIADIAGGSPPWCRSGPLLRIAAGRVGDLWGHLSGHEPDVNSAAIQLSDKYHYFSSARAERELDYRIRPLEQTLRDAWAWLQQNGYVS